MTIDGTIEIQIKVALVSALSAGSIDGTVAQSYNPTQQGAPLKPVVLFARLGLARRYGFQGTKYAFDMGSDPPTFTKTESWFLNARYQISVLLNQDVVAAGTLNAYDVLDLCAGVLQSRETIDAFKAAGLAVLRVTDIQNVRSLDDSDRWTLDPSFDLIVVYQNTLTTTVPGTIIVQGQVSRVC